MIAPFQGLPGVSLVGLPVRRPLNATPPLVRPPTRPLSACKSHSVSSGQPTKTCLHCGMPYTDADNGPVACEFHGHMTGHRGLYSLAPAHQGIDGEWTEGSGVIVYKWNSEGNRPNTGSSNWKRRWTCCGIYEDARPCRRGWHVCYDDGATRY